MSYLKDKNRNRLKPETLNEYMNLRLNGPRIPSELDSYSIAESYLKSHRIQNPNKRKDVTDDDSDY